MRRIFLGLGALALGFVTAIGGAAAQPANQQKSARWCAMFPAASA